MLQWQQTLNPKHMSIYHFILWEEELLHLSRYPSWLMIHLLPWSWTRGLLLRTFQKNTTRTHHQHQKPELLLKMHSGELLQWSAQWMPKFGTNNRCRSYLIQVVDDWACVLDRGYEICVIHFSMCAKPFKIASNTYCWWINSKQSASIRIPLKVVSGNFNLLTVEGEASDWLPMVSGVPQRSVLVHYFCNGRICSHYYDRKTVAESSQVRLLSCFCLELTIFHGMWTWPHPLMYVCGYYLRAATIRGAASIQINMVYHRRTYLSWEMVSRLFKK